MLTRQGIQRAIETIEFSRKTHIDWADWLAKGNKEGSSYLDNEEFHREAIAGYGHVLAVLKEMLDQCS